MPPPGYQRGAHKKPRWMPDMTFKGLPKTDLVSNAIECPGCSKSFRGKVTGAKVLPELDYYVHCVEKCHAYKRNCFLKECHDCELMFLSLKSFSLHNRYSHQDRFKGDDFIRDWMPRNVITGGNLSAVYDYTMECQGCGKSYPAKRRSNRASLEPRRDFVVHCIEECPAFKALNLDWECPVCRKRFLVNMHGKHGCNNGPAPGRKPQSTKSSFQGSRFAKSSTLQQSSRNWKREVKPERLAIQYPQKSTKREFNELSSKRPLGGTINGAINRHVMNPYMGMFPNRNIDYTIPIPNDEFFGNFEVRDMVNDPFDPNDDYLIEDDEDEDVY